MHKIADLSHYEAVLHPGEQPTGRVTHHYGPKIVIGEVKEQHTSTQQLLESSHEDLDRTGQLGLKAFQMLQSEAYKAAKRNRPHDGVSWNNDIPGLKAPGELPLPTVQEETVGAPTSSQLIGSVTVSIVIVSGPGSLAYSEDEVTQVIAECHNGLRQPGIGPVQFYYHIPPTVKLDLPDDPNAPDGQKEAYWLNPTMQVLGFQNPSDFVNSVRAGLRTQWTYCAFFVKYSLWHFAYAKIGGPYLCMQYSNDGWGPTNIDRVFVHETGHIFGAPDEYSDSSCDCKATFGFYRLPNYNCESCALGGAVECIMRANTWNMCAWTPWHLGCAQPFRELWSTGNVGQGYPNIGFRVGDFNKDGKTEIIQLWNNNGALAMIMYGWVNVEMRTVWDSGNVNQGAANVGFLTGDVNGDGQDEIIQLWNNGGALAMIVYGWSNGAMTTLWSTSKAEEGAGGGFLIADINKDGKAEIIQYWNNGSLAMAVYGWVNGAMTRLWRTENIGQGYPHICFLTGDVNGDGQDEIIQLWNNGALSLGIIVYGWSHGAMTTLWSTSKAEEGPGIDFLMADINKDGKAEMIQIWTNGGALAMAVYGWVNGAMTRLWRTSSMGQGYAHTNFLIGKFANNNQNNLVQLWNNNGRLAAIEYTWAAGAMTVTGDSPNVWNEGAANMGMLVGDINKDGKDELIQLRQNNTQLAMIVYGSL